MKKKLLFVGLAVLTLIALGLSIFNLLNTKNQLLDVGGGTPPSAYSSTLSLGESSTDTTINVNSVVAGDTTLTTALIYPGIFLTIEPQTSSKREIVFCTGISSTSFTGCTRGLSSVGNSMAAVTANQQSHQANVLIIASDPAQFYSHILVNRWNESWIYGKQHQASATSSDRTGFSLGDGSDVDIMLVFKDGTATATAPRLYRQESTGNLIWSGNGVDDTTLSGGGASATGGRGTVFEPVTGGHDVNVATSTDTNSANLYGLSFISQGGRDRLRFSGNYFGDFTINNLFASSTNTSSTSYFSHLVPASNNAWDLGSGTSSWRNINGSGTLFVAGNATTTGNFALGNAITDLITFWGRLASSSIPNSNNELDIGYYDNAWRNIYASGTVFTNSLNLAGAFNSSSTSYQDSVITFASSTTGLYAYYHQATSSPDGILLRLTVPIDGGLLSKNGSIRVFAVGSSTTGAGNNDENVNLSITYGGTTFTSFAIPATCTTGAGPKCSGNPANSNSIRWQLETLISNRNSKSVQTSYNRLERYGNTDHATSSRYRATGVVNSDANQNLIITLTPDNGYGQSGIDDFTVEILNGR